MPLAPGSRLGPYEVAAPLGVGGMGEVYRARDTRLGRDVAIKILPADMSRDPDRRQRFEREALAIAAISHPHICALYDIGVFGDVSYLVMEMLEGETLAARLVRGPIPADEALPLALDVLDALEAMHGRGLVHRDLKPANIFLTRHGVKLLDFGLARPIPRSEAPSETVAEPIVTQAGMIVGTPRYMAPEQIRGGCVDARSDLFAMAVVIYEMLAGRPAFEGSSIIDILHAVGFADPAPMPGGTVSAAVDQVIRQALAKDADERPASAAEFSTALRGALREEFQPVSPPRSRTTRLIVLPFRVLRVDPDTDFLAFSLPDAVAASLAGLESIVVRSSLTAAKFAEGLHGLHELAAEAKVDAALVGTLMRAGDQIRVSAQLIEVPGGALLWSHTVQAAVQDLFQLQDVLTSGIVTSLRLPLTAREHSGLRKNAPANAQAYELYLKANRLMMDSTRWADVRQLYEQAVELDPGYAPAWARLGRVLRVMAKYGGPDAEIDRARAERAFQRALALSPDLPMAHHLYTYLEVENGRAEQAMVRLLQQAHARSTDPELYAGLVITCRYCGLLEASVAAYEHAYRLDPAVSTSIAYTYYLRGEFEKAIQTDLGDAYASILSRYRLGRSVEAIAALHDIERRTPHPASRLIAMTYRLALEGNAEAAVAAAADVRATNFRDPEGFYLFACSMAASTADAVALEYLGIAVDGGFQCHATLARDPCWDGLRQTPLFQRWLETAAAASERARQVYLENDGAALLGVADGSSLDRALPDGTPSGGSSRP